MLLVRVLFPCIVRWRSNSVNITERITTSSVVPLSCEFWCTMTTFNVFWDVLGVDLHAYKGQVT